METIILYVAAVLIGSVFGAAVGATLGWLSNGLLRGWHSLCCLLFSDKTGSLIGTVGLFLWWFIIMPLAYISKMPSFPDLGGPGTLMRWAAIIIALWMHLRVGSKLMLRWKMPWGDEDEAEPCVKA